MSTLPPSYNESFRDDDPDKAKEKDQFKRPPTKTNELEVPVNLERTESEDVDPLPEIFDEGFTTAQKDFKYKEVRRRFIKKVYITLGLQLLVTAIVVFIVTFLNNKTGFVLKNVWTYWMAYGIFITTYITIFCMRDLRRKHPHNIICLSVFTLALSYMAGVIASFHSTKSILIAFGATFVICAAITIFSIQTKFDVTRNRLFLMVMIQAVLIFCVITCFTYFYNWYVQVVYGCLGALLFGLFLVYRTQLVMGGGQYQLNPEEYIYGALCLYMDIVHIFLFILGIRRK